VSFHDFSTGRETGRLIRAKDWSTTSLGPRAAWPRSLTNSLSMILELPTAAILFWGPDQVQLYNDGYAVIMGPRHPRHLGSTFRACWPEAYDAIIPWMQRVLEKGETVEVNQTLVPLTRHGFTEEAYFTFSFSPMRDDEGKIAGILQLVTEVTSAVLGERRTRSLHELSSQTANARTLTGAASLAVDVLCKENADVPFCLLYLSDPEAKGRLIASASAGLADGFAPFPVEVNAGREDSPVLPELSRAARERTVVPFELEVGRVDRLVQSPDARSRTVVALPILASEAQNAADVLLVGINPRLAFDAPYRAFLELVAAQVANLLGTARANDEERRRAAAIDRAKTELEQANRELEAFSYSVSHDLRAPLRAIDGFSKLLLEEHGASLTEGASDYLARVRSATQRMSTLIDDLLRLSRITRAQLERRKVDLSGLARAILEMLRTREPARSVEVSIADALAVDADPQLTKVLLENLLENAWKFTSKRADARILFGVEAGPELVFFVRDNGAGFDMRYANKLFAPFQRLHKVSEFEGTGIGLATVHRIVMRHGGRIWATSELGQGTTVFFTLGGA
jgi:signal transduction histidine kinase